MIADEILNMKGEKFFYRGNSVLTVKNCEKLLPYVYMPIINYYILFCLMARLVLHNIDSISYEALLSHVCIRAKRFCEITLREIEKPRHTHREN